MPGADSNEVPEFKVRINGADVPEKLTMELLAVSVHEDVDAASMFSLHLLNWDMARQQVTWVDDSLLAEGNEVAIQMGYRDRLAQLAVGEITSLEPEFHAGEAPTLVVRGYDRRHRLLRGRKTRSFSSVKDSDIADQIAREASLTANATDTGVTYDYVLQNNQTDLEFLLARAQRIGYEVIVEGKTLAFRPLQNSRQEVLTLARDGDMIDFYPRLTTSTQAGETEVRGWDPKAKEKIVGKAAAGDENSKMGGSTGGPAAADAAFGAAVTSWVDMPVATQAEADQVALGQYQQMALAYITGEGLCRGRTDLRAGTVIKVDGVGKRFSGQYYVTSAVHTYSPAVGYRTAFSIRRNAT